jgi:hypothetical protein
MTELLIALRTDPRWCWALLALALLGMVLGACDDPIPGGRDGW